MSYALSTGGETVKWRHHLRKDAMSEIYEWISKDRTVSGGHGREKRSFHYAKSMSKGFKRLRRFQ